MPKEILSVPGGKSAWQDGDTFIGKFEGVRTVKLGKKSFQVVRFTTLKGNLERNVTAKWDELITGKVIKPGDVLEVKAYDEVTTGKRGQRFRPFGIVRLTGKEVPKALKK